MGTCCAADEKNNRHNPYIYDPRRNPINSQSGSNHYIQSSAQSYPGNHPHSPNQNQYPPGYNSQNNGPYPPQYRPQQGANMYPPRNPQIQQPNYPPNNGFQNPFVNQSAHQPHQPNYVDNQGVRRMNTLPDNQNYNPYPNQQMVPPEQISNTLIGMFKKNDGNQPYLQSQSKNQNQFENQGNLNRQLFANLPERRQEQKNQNMLATGEPSLDNSIRPKIKITESQMKENLPIYEESKVNVNISERPK